MLNVSTTSRFQQTATGVMVGILASFPNATSYEPAAVAPAPHILFGDNKFSIIGAESTKVSINARAINVGVDPVLTFQHELAAVFEDFLKTQKPLEEEFAKVLSDNLWELYVR